ncbi:MAG: hypothetical protein R2795_09815 [Saprospiraceae bacterium]
MFRIILMLLVVSTSLLALEAQIFHQWIRSNPGGGGAFSTIGAGPAAPNGGSQIIAGSDLSGAYFSWDGGQSWGVYGSLQGLTNTHVSGIGFHPTDADVFFLGVDGGIYKSSTGGGYFYQVFPDGYITDIQVAPSQPNRVYATYHTYYDSSEELFCVPMMRRKLV